MADKSKNNFNATVELLLKDIPSVHESTCCISVLEMFHNDSKLYALPVVNDKSRPVGLIVRQTLTEYFSRQYIKELKGKKPISFIMDNAPIIVDKKTSIEDISHIIMAAGMEHMVSGFIITQDKKYLGMVNGYDLLKEMTRRNQEHLFGLAHFDQLTGLPNRTLLMDRLYQGFSVSNRTLRPIFLLFIDLDGFKLVNDTHGHAIGDRLLKEAAERLHSCLREGDTASRLGGDEFVVILLESDIERAIIIAERILEILKTPYEFGKKIISNVSASIGIAGYPFHADEFESLLKAADNAMYVAKQNGKNRYEIYTLPQNE